MVFCFSINKNRGKCYDFCRRQNIIFSFCRNLPSYGFNLTKNSSFKYIGVLCYPKHGKDSLCEKDDKTQRCFFQHYSVPVYSCLLS